MGTALLDGRKVSVLGWMARGLPSTPTMLPKCSGEVLNAMGVRSREDEAATGKAGKDSCPINCTHRGKQGFGGKNIKVTFAVLNQQCQGPSSGPAGPVHPHT